MSLRVILDKKYYLDNPEFSIRILSDIIITDIHFFIKLYPEFNSWFNDTVIPGILLGERTIVAEYRNKVLVGYCILKHTLTESKLCTLRVRDVYKSSGLGVRLFNIAFDILGTDKPLLSISDVMFDSYNKLFSYFGFTNEAEYKGLYVEDNIEYSYNGLLINK